MRRPQTFREDARIKHQRPDGCKLRSFDREGFGSARSRRLAITGITIEPNANFVPPRFTDNRLATRC